MEENQTPPIFCPTLPSPASFRATQNLTIQNAIVTTIQNEPENLAVLQQLVQNLDASDKASLCGNLLLFYMQRRRENADDQRMLTILRLCPVAVFCRDDQNMSCFHYFVMRQTPYIDGAQLLYALLDLAPQLPGIQNNFGESPLHQLLGQQRPCLRVLRVLANRCPQAFRETIRLKEGGRLPIHVAMLNVRLTDTHVTEAIKLCIEAYPASIFIDLVETSLLLRVNGPTGGVRVSHNWSPYTKSKEDAPHIFNFIENKLMQIALERCYSKLPGMGASLYFEKGKKKL